jgi:NAD(P)-dependent dehydrogenase (short-subunit alcohol dehydrogenase family)
MDLRDGRVALVIGGANGIGLASCQALAAAGAAVVIADRDGDAAERAAKLLRGAGGMATGRKVDGASLPQLRGLFDYIDAAFGKLNVLFSNVGFPCANGFDVTEAQFDEAFDINLKSHFFATQYGLPLLRRGAPHAAIIYTSSTGGLRPGRGGPLYAISKSSILMLARAAAREFGPEGVRVHALCPGHIDTAFPRQWTGLSEEAYQAAVEQFSQTVPLRRVGQAEDVAGVVAFLASDAAMHLTGLAIPIDGGQTA